MNWKIKRIKKIYSKNMMSDSNKLYDKEKIMSMIISLNPTGTMNFSGTFQPNGTNNVL